jgi:hypothetical protein
VSDADARKVYSKSGTNLALAEVRHMNRLLTRAAP